MNIVERTGTRLVVAFRQDSHVFLAGFFACFGLIMAIAGIANGGISYVWPVGFVTAGIAAALLFLGLEKHTRIAFDAAAAEIAVHTRQFRRDTTLRLPLSEVADVTVESTTRQAKTLHALRFVGPDGTLLPFKRYLEPWPKVGAPLLAMRDWLAEHHAGGEGSPKMSGNSAAT